jgi:4-amino-4-deoxy-L-arabinose transferase-like glycosyltransferase
MLTFLVARRLGASHAGALLAAALLLMLHLPLRASRRIGEDSLLATWLSAALLAYLCTESRPRAWLTWGALAGLAMITKGAVAVLAPLAIAPDLLRRPRVLTTRWPYLGAAVALAVAAPWHVAQTLRFGSEFWREYLGYNVLRRALDAHVLPQQTSSLFYVRDLVGHDSVLVPVLALGVVVAIVAALRARPLNAATVVTLAALIAPSLIFSAARSRLPHYMLPAYAPAAALAGAGWTLVLERSRGGRLALIGLTALVLVAGAWLRLADLVAPDYAPADKKLALLAAQRLPPSAPLYVFDHYHAAAAFYGDRPILAAISSQTAYDQVAVSRLLARTGKLLHMDARARCTCPGHS